MPLLHELFIVIIAILHAKIEAKPHSLKICQYECLFSLRVVYKHNFFAEKLDQLTWLVLVYKI